MHTLVIDDAIMPLIQRSLELEKQRLKHKLAKYEAELKALEAQHMMPSEEFLRRYRAGELGDEEHWMRWEFLKETHEALKVKLRLLEQVVHESQSAH